MKVSPVYRRLRIEDGTPSRAHLRETHADMLPAAFHGQLRDGLTLFTLGSVYRAFPFRDKEKEWERMGRYHYVIVEEAAQVAGEDLFLILNCIVYSAYPHD